MTDFLDTNNCIKFTHDDGLRPNEFKDKIILKKSCISGIKLIKNYNDKYALMIMEKNSGSCYIVSVKDSIRINNEYKLGFTELNTQILK